MTNLSREVENDSLQYYFTAGAVLITRPTAWFVGLHSAAGANESTSAWAATEISSTANAYTRPAIGWGTVTTGGSMSNSASVSFPVATGSWGTITHAAVWTSATYGGGTALFWINTNDITVTSGEQVTIAAGAITLAMT